MSLKSRTLLSWALVNRGAHCDIKRTISCRKNSIPHDIVLRNPTPSVSQSKTLWACYRTPTSRRLPPAEGRDTLFAHPGPRGPSAPRTPPRRGRPQTSPRPETRRRKKHSRESVEVTMTRSRLAHCWWAQRSGGGARRI